MAEASQGVYRPVSGEICLFTADHLEEATQLYVAIFNAPPWHDRWTMATAGQRLADILATPGTVGYALFEDELVGFVLGHREPWFDGTHFYLKEMCVKVSRQRSGLGTRLLRQLERELALEGVSRVYLLTMRDGPAAAFYAKNGYYTSPKMALMARRL